jgi:nucleoside phosphorylase
MSSSQEGAKELASRIESQLERPADRHGFKIAVICALPLEADAVDAVFDFGWDSLSFGKAQGDPNAYSTGTIEGHNVVLAHMPGMGKANAAAVAANIRSSFPNIGLVLVVGACGCSPFTPDGDEIILGDVIISTGVVQYDLGRRFPEQFVRKDTLSESLGRPNAEIRSFLAKLRCFRGRKLLQDRMARHIAILQHESGLAAHYPGTKHDMLFESAYRHVSDGKLCNDCGCDGELRPRSRLLQDSPQPMVYFGTFASGDTVVKSGQDRDNLVRQEDVIGFEMEGAGVWDSFPCVIIEGACDYADSHKVKEWQRYAAATAAACMKAFLESWTPSSIQSGKILCATTPIYLLTDKYRAKGDQWPDDQPWL